MKIYCFFLFNIFLVLVTSQASTENTIIVKDSLKNILINPKNNLNTKNPLTSAAISALIPGGGQVYTGNYVKSGMFIASEVIIGLVAYNRYIIGSILSQNAKIIQDSMILFKDAMIIKSDTLWNKSNAMDSIFEDTTFLSLHYQMKYDYNRLLERDNRYFLYQSLAWMGGFYYWNILDALKNTKFFMNDNSKKPSTAGWLAAIPALGLGQLYNGELSKAGMIFMVQANLAHMIYNYHTLMRICEDNLKKIDSPFTRESKDQAAAELRGSWDSKRNDAFRNRNMWAWYSIAFYFYSIFDAIVDAHLHDAATKMKLEPDLLPGKGIGLNYTLKF